MTPEQVGEMPNRDCILMIEGMKPVYDRKNRPFNTRIWKEAEAAAGKTGYTHPVRVIHDKKRDVYKTIDCEEKILMIDKEEEEFYRNAAKTDQSILIFEMDEEEFLYLNWDEQKPPTIEELEALVRDSNKKDVSDMEEPEDVKKFSDETEKVKISAGGTGLEAGEEAWDLSGSMADCLKRYADKLSEEKMQILLKGMEDGLSESQLKQMLIMKDTQDMERYRRIFLHNKNRG